MAACRTLFGVGLDGRVDIITGGLHNYSCPVIIPKNVPGVAALPQYCYRDAVYTHGAFILIEIFDYPF
jgi:hypothetical protein